jgi:DNA repair protein recO
VSKELIEVSGLVFKQKKYKDFDVLSKIMTAENGIFTLLIKGG